MTIRPFFRWFDLWIGAYFDRQNRALYVCPLPMIGVKIMQDAWPKEISFSMAPFGYCTHADRTSLTETAAAYDCRHCPFKVSVDPRDMTLDNVKHLMRAHVDESH
jgi:hypothetical protein